MTPSRRRFLTAGAATGAAVLAGCIDAPRNNPGSGGSGGSGDGGDGEIPTGTPESTPDGPVASLTAPDDAGDRTYAYAGDPDAPTVTYYGNWKCPACASFGGGLMEEIAADYVAPGTVGLEFRALVYDSNGEPFLGRDAPRAGHAGLAAWNVDPASYWAFHEHVFANQPPETQEWATTDRLTRFAWEAGVSDHEAFRTQVSGEAYGDALQASADAAFGQHGVGGTPSLVIDGQTVTPLGNEGQVRSMLDDLAQG